MQIKDNTIDDRDQRIRGLRRPDRRQRRPGAERESLFFKKHGFKVRLHVSEDENWSEFNEGKMAASVTTVDVLAVYGKQFHVVVPAQIGFSRGADGVVVRSDIKRINALKGKIVATAQFTEVDFFIRYLAQEAGLAIRMLPSLDAHTRSREVESDLHRGWLRARAICSSSD